LAPVTSKKNRVRNLSDITQPWLELLGVLIGVCAARFVVKEFPLPISKRYHGQTPNVSNCTNFKTLPLFVKN